MTTRDLLIATVVLTLYSHWGRGDIPWCSLVEEGASFKVDCSGQTGSNTYIVWEMEKDGKLEPISRCSTIVSKCDSSKAGISLSNFPVGERFNSSMTIRTVTSYFRDSKISCGVWDGKSGQTHNIVLCKMAVFRLGDAIHCSATYNPTDDNAVLECVSQNVFPGLSCRMFEKIDGHLTQKNVSMSSRISNKGGQVQGSCHTVVNIRRPGQYNYDFSVSVTTNSNTSTEERALKTELKSTVFNISYPPKVKVLHDKVFLCSQKSVQTRMTCSVKWLKTVPEFNLTLAGKTLPTLTPTWKYDEKDEYKIYTAVSEFSVVRSSKDAMLACDVRYLDGGVRKVVNDTKRLQVSWAPETAPRFKVNDSIVLNGFIETSKDDVISIVCLVNGGQPDVYVLNISCADRNGSVFQSASSVSSSVSVVALSDRFQGEGSCTCTAEHETNCPQLSSRLYVFVDRPAPRSSRGYRDVLSGMTPVYYVIFATLVLLVVPFIIAFGVFLARHGHGLYAVYQSKYRNVNMALTRSRAPRDQDQPPPVPGPRIPPRVANNGASEHTALNNSTDDSEGWEEDNISISLKANPREVVVSADDSSAIYNPNEDYLEPLPLRTQPIPPPLPTSINSQIPPPLPPPIQIQTPPPLPPPIQTQNPPPLPPPIQPPVNSRLPSPTTPPVPPLPLSTPPPLPPRNESFSTSPIVYTTVLPHQSTTSHDNNDSSHTPLKTDTPPPLPPRLPGSRHQPDSPRDSLAILTQTLLGSDDEGGASPCSSVGLSTPPARRLQRNGSLKSLNGNEDSLTALMLTSSKINSNHVH